MCLASGSVVVNKVTKNFFTDAHLKSNVFSKILNVELTQRESSPEKRYGQVS